MNEPPVEDVFGRSRRFRPNSKLVMLLAPAANHAAVSFRTAQQPKLSVWIMRSVADESLMAVVAAVVPRLETRLFTRRRPSQLLAVAFPVNTVRALSTEEVSRNSHPSTLKSVGVEVPVAVKKLATLAKFATNRKFWRLMFAAVTGIFAAAAVKVSVGLREP